MSHSAEEFRAKNIKRLEEKSDIVKQMDKELRRYSKTLRHRFLKILVKCAAKEFKIQTVRNDWRTRKGMLAFLADNWEKIQVLIHSDTFFRWFCCFYSQLENVFIKGNLAMFLYQNWNQFKTYLYNRNSILFLSINSTEISTLVTRSSSPIPQGWYQMEPGITFCKIIEQMRGPVESSAISQSPSSSSEQIEDIMTFSPLEEEEENVMISEVPQKSDTLQKVEYLQKPDESQKGAEASSLEVLSSEADVFELATIEGNVDDFVLDAYNPNGEMFFDVCNEF